MKIYFLSYATHDAMGFYKNQDILCNDALKYGNVDEVIKLRGNDINSGLNEIDSYLKDVKSKYPRIHKAKYYIWKSYVIKEALKKINHLDMVIYHDVGRDCYPFKINDDLRWFCEYVQDNHRGLYVNFGPFQNRRFTKRDCFKVMNCDSECYWNHKQANGSWSVYQKKPIVRKFVNEWYGYCTHPSMIVTDIKSKVKEFDQYEAHRHDQSILTNMLIKYSKEYGLKLDPKTEGKLPRPWGWEKDMCLAISRIKKHICKK